MLAIPSTAIDESKVLIASKRIFKFERNWIRYWEKQRNWMSLSCKV